MKFYGMMRELAGKVLAAPTLQLTPQVRGHLTISPVIGGPVTGSLDPARHPPTTGPVVARCRVMRLLRWLATHLVRIVPALLVLGLVVAMAAPVLRADASSTSTRAPAVTLANVAHANPVSIAITVVLAAVVIMIISDARRGRLGYLLSHAVPRRYVTTYGVELAGEWYPELATWRQWGRRISDHRTYRLAGSASTI